MSQYLIVKNSPGEPAKYFQKLTADGIIQTTKFPELASKSKVFKDAATVAKALTDIERNRNNERVTYEPTKEPTAATAV